MRKKFEEPQITVIVFAANDVITASGISENIGGWHDDWILPPVNNVMIN